MCRLTSRIRNGMFGSLLEHFHSTPRVTYAHTLLGSEMSLMVDATNKMLFMQCSQISLHWAVHNMISTSYYSYFECGELAMIVLLSRSIGLSLTDLYIYTQYVHMYISKVHVTT